MALDLGLTYFDRSSFGFTGQNTENFMNTDANAVLYVFKPHHRQFEDVALRPFQYHFDANFLGNVQELSDLAVRGTASPNDLINHLHNHNNLNDNMMPTADAAFLFKASHLSDYWQFALVLTETGTGLNLNNTMMSTPSSSKMRRIYTGYFLDEPFNPATVIGQKRTLNPHAVMVMTHKTAVGSAVNHGHRGAETFINTISSDEILNPEISRALTVDLLTGQGVGGNNATRFHLTTPQSCFDSLSVNDDGTMFSSPNAHSDISRETGTQAVADVFERPGKNVSKVVESIVRYQDHETHHNRIAGNRVYSDFGDEFMNESQRRIKLSKFASMPRANLDSKFDLDLNTPMSAVSLSDRFNGDLDVVDFAIEVPAYYETADQMQSSILNQYSFLIASVVPPLLNAAGLNSINFEYQIARMMGEIKQDFIPHRAYANYPVPDMDLVSMAKAVGNELVSGIFAVIFSSVGAFHVAVDSSVTGKTVIRLNLVDQQAAHNTQDFVMPSALGGMISPLLGNDITHTSNSQSVEGLFSHIAGMTGMDDDTRQFAKYAENRVSGNQLALMTAEDDPIYDFGRMAD